VSQSVTANKETFNRTTSRPRLIVVSYLAHAPLGPRGDRTRELLTALQCDWSTELVARPIGSVKSTRPYIGRSLARKTLHFTHSSVLLDKFELWSFRRFFSWRPSANGALLIGFPFSPLVYASRQLSASGIPYVVDVGDPWVLTADRPLVRSFARVRARRAEHRLWTGARGAVVTTENQACGLRDLYPELPILVRPNGFPMANQATSSIDFPCQQRRPGSVLKLAHFGNISSARIDIVPFLASLARSGVWERIELHVYGSDWTGTLSEGRDVTVVFHQLQPWSDIIRLAVEYDLAIVIGNSDPKQLPSKAVFYLQLPIPRLAVVENPQADALAAYVADKMGWIVLPADANDPAVRIRRHLSRTWSDDDLAPPPSESWGEVSGEVARFVKRVLTPDLSDTAVGP
jgi:hypothetical protein